MPNITKSQAQIYIAALKAIKYCVTSKDYFYLDKFNKNIGLCKNLRVLYNEYVRNDTFKHDNYEDAVNLSEIFEELGLHPDYPVEMQIFSDNIVAAQNYYLGSIKNSTIYDMSTYGGRLRLALVDTLILYFQNILDDKESQSTQSTNSTNSTHQCTNCTESTSWHYSPNGDITRFTSYPGTNRWEICTKDKNNNELEFRNSNGNFRTSTYDKNNNKTSFNNKYESWESTFDENNNIITYKENFSGVITYYTYKDNKLQKQTTQYKEITYEYDSLLNCIKEVHVDLRDNTNKTITYTHIYDKDNRLISTLKFES